MKIIEQKTFENEEEEKYKVAFFLENVDNNNFLYLNAFVEVEGKKLLTIYYNYKDDGYFIANVDNIFILQDNKNEFKRGLKETAKPEF